MKATSLILAAGDDATVKIIIGAIAAVFWLVTQIAGAATKKTNKRPLPPVPQSELPRRPNEVGPGQSPHPDLPGARRGILTKSGLPKPVPVRNAPQPVRRAPAVRPPALPGVMRRPSPAVIPPTAPVPRRAPVAPTRETVHGPERTAQGSAGRSTSSSISGTIDGALPSAGSAQRPLARADFIGALLRPRNLRKAYLLTEVLQPPLALRE